MAVKTTQAKAADPQARSTAKASAAPITHSTSNLPTGAILNNVQAKLELGKPGDSYEQEADRVAAQVVQHIHAPSPLPPPLPADSNHPLQRHFLQAQGTPVGQVDADFEQNLKQAGNGQPLARQIQAKMGEAMGADFSGVKVHANAQADNLSRAIQAKAFTTGNNIYFRQGEYQPDSKSGQELIAHELTHTLQQGAVQHQVSKATHPIQASSIGSGAIQAKYLENQPLFYQDTYGGYFPGIGRYLFSREALARVDQALNDYKTKILDPEQKRPTLATDPKHINEKLNLLFKLKDVVEFWVFQQFDLKDASQQDQTAINPTLDLQEEITAAIKQQVQVFNNVKGSKVSEQDLEDKLRSDSMNAALKGKVARALDAILPKGSLSQLSAEFGLAIDIHPPGYVGLDLSLDAERKENDGMNVRGELAFTGGVKVPNVFDIKAKLGGYIEAEAADSSKVMSLLSYGFYRKVVEQKLIPGAVAGVIWGGSLREDGQAMAAKLAGDVERNVFGAEGGEDAFVDLGLLAGIGVSVGDSENLGGGVAYKYTTGQKYTKDSVGKSSRVIGEVKPEDVGNRGNKKKGEETSAHNFTGTITMGPFNGELEYTKSEDSHEIAASLEYSGLPRLVPLTSGILGIVIQMKNAAQKKQSGNFEVVDALDDFSRAIKALADNPSFSQAVPSTSTSGEVAVGASKEGSESWKMEITLNEKTSLPVPDLGVASFSGDKTSTKVKFFYKGGKWGVQVFGLGTSAKKEFG